MKFLIFRHVRHEHAGLIEAAIQSRGATLEYVDLGDSPGAPPDPAGYSGLVFMGGPMSANDGLPYLEQEIAWIAEAARRNQPVLGVCLGAQMIAKALGGRVYPNPVKEIGWFDIEFAPEARSDRLFCGAQPRETVFQWHGETFDPPPGAVRLAHAATCREQAFRMGQNIYGLQFHLEVTPEMIAEWCGQDAHCGDRRELAQPLDPHRNAARLRELSELVFGAWCDLAAASAASAGAA